MLGLEAANTYEKAPGELPLLGLSFSGGVAPGAGETQSREAMNKRSTYQNMSATDENSSSAAAMYRSSG